MTTVMRSGNTGKVRYENRVSQTIQRIVEFGRLRGHRGLFIECSFSLNKPQT